MAKGTIITGLDIGSSKISAVVCHALPSLDGKMDIIGVGVANSKGLRRGVVVDINATATAIREAISEAELMAGINIESVCLGISGEHVIGQTSRGVITVKNTSQITKGRCRTGYSFGKGNSTLSLKGRIFFTYLNKTLLLTWTLK